MGQFIVKLDEGKYVMWSSIVDAPVSYILNRKGIVELAFEKQISLWDSKYNKASQNYEREQAEVRVKKADEKGTSSYLDTLSHLLTFNRAGSKGTSIGKEKIIKKYTYKEESGYTYNKIGGKNGRGKKRSG